MSFKKESSLSDEELLERWLKKGDWVAMKILRERWDPELRRILWRVPEAAEDIISKVFLKLIELKDSPLPSSIDGIRCFSAYIGLMVRSEEINYVRRQKRSRNREIGLTEVDAETLANCCDLRRQILNKEKLVLCCQMLETIPEKQAAIFRLAYFEEMPIEEIAELLNKTNNYVAVTLHRVRKKLEKFLKKTLG